MTCLLNVYVVKSSSEPCTVAWSRGTNHNSDPLRWQMEQLQDNAVVARVLASGFLDDESYGRYVDLDNPPPIVSVVGTQIIGQAIVQAGHFKEVQAGYLGADAAFIKNLTVNSLKIANSAATKLYETTVASFSLFTGSDEAGL